MTKAVIFGRLALLCTFCEYHFRPFWHVQLKFTRRTNFIFGIYAAGYAVFLHSIVIMAWPFHQA